MHRPSTEWFLVQDSAVELRRITIRLQLGFWLIVCGCLLAATGMILATFRG